eukprot:TRINITY_DN801_c0_g1_i1.p1 TRINITY_DN801_c0_g1~~TRINITY_DN801_c0_g1_i1.p1  ORF type:complete len:320 (+),score=54.82 TRINITY_DN801_c0_g1_i1:122-1081(+)
MKAVSSLGVTGAKTLGRRGSFDGNCLNTVLKRRSSFDAAMRPAVRRSSYTYVRSAMNPENIPEEGSMGDFGFHPFEYHKSPTSVSIKTPISRDNIFKMLELEPKPSVTSKDLPCEMVFLGGAPGAGKGTNSLHIAAVRGHTAEPIVVSSLLDTPECKRLKDQGQMVDDAFVFDLLMKEVQKPAYRNGVVIDGFPRTAQQAEFLTKMHEDMAEKSETPPQFMFVMLHVDENASIDRQLSRGEFIKQQNSKRVEDGLAPLELRVTDSSYASAKARYTVFEQQLQAVLDLGKKFTSVIIDASSTIDNVRHAITNQMSALPKM